MSGHGVWHGDCDGVTNVWHVTGTDPKPWLMCVNTHNGWPGQGCNVKCNGNVDPLHTRIPWYPVTPAGPKLRYTRPSPLQSPHYTHHLAKFKVAALLISLPANKMTGCSPVSQSEASGQMLTKAFQILQLTTSIEATLHCVLYQG